MPVLPMLLHVCQKKKKRTATNVYCMFSLKPRLERSIDGGSTWIVVDASLADYQETFTPYKDPYQGSSFSTFSYRMTATGPYGTSEPSKVVNLT